jgi:hypothetical protein
LRHLRQIIEDDFLNVTPYFTTGVDWRRPFMPECELIIVHLRMTYVIGYMLFLVPCALVAQDSQRMLNISFINVTYLMTNVTNLRITYNPSPLQKGTTYIYSTASPMLITSLIYIYLVQYTNILDKLADSTEFGHCDISLSLI